MRLTRSAHPTDDVAVKGIIFDLDGTLYRMRWFFRPLLFAVLVRNPFRLPRFLAVRSRFAGTDLGSQAVLLAALCKALSEREHASPAALHDWIRNGFYPAFIATMPLQRSGRSRLNETLQHLRIRGIKLAVLSDYDAVKERLCRLRIPTEYFDIITSCEASGALKPSVRPFLEIATAWNIAPSSMLVIGDRDDSDGIAARRAGMQFLLLGNRRGQSDATTAYRWKEARNVLMTLGNAQDG
ncbi:MAG: HAD family hydrolase [Chitinispirillaceae bacterium]|nr:HAD family hydrolase [Chitinispirillaceae bacterium]